MSIGLTELGIPSPRHLLLVTFLITIFEYESKQGASETSRRSDAAWNIAHREKKINELKVFF
jgi:hypothetical protein